jgi:hypothetical protein
MEIANLTGLEKPITTLIEKISNATGVLYEPTKIVKKAMAEAKAAVILANSQVEATAIQRRAEQRWQKEDENNASVLSKAIPLLEETAKPENIDSDWLANLFEKTKIVSDEEMQGLWAKVLAGEANTPGKFSRKTINILNDLDKNDAELFTSLCGFVWHINRNDPVVFNVSDKIYNDQGINFTTLSHLEAIGLVKFENTAGFAIILHDLFKSVAVEYYDKCMSLSILPQHNNRIQVGKVFFTQAGRELYSICNSQPVAGFFDYVHDEFAKKNYVAPRAITPAAA